MGYGLKSLELLIPVKRASACHLLVYGFRCPESLPGPPLASQPDSSGLSSWGSCFPGHLSSPLDLVFHSAFDFVVTVWWLILLVNLTHLRELSTEEVTPSDLPRGMSVEIFS